MNWRDDLNKELSQWDRALEQLTRVGARDAELAMSMGGELTASLKRLESIVSRAKKQNEESLLEPLRSFLYPPQKDHLPKKDFTDSVHVLGHIQTLVIVKARLHSVLTSPEPRWVERSEAAFMHLQMLLSSDKQLRQRWTTAWKNQTEVALESLGATHFLHHHLYGFKASTKQAATDQVFGPAVLGDANGVLNTDDILRAGTPLVLTEWKKVDGDQSDKLAQALAQLKNYPQTALAALELRRTRFAVLVSVEHLKNLPPTETLADGSIARIVNIAIAPTSVSKRP